MPLTVTYSFATTAESFTGTAGANSTLSYDSANGNPAGALKSRITGRNNNSANKWSRTLTFADMGVPTGATVTDIKSGSYSWRCTEYTTGATSTQGPVTMSWTGNSATLVSSSTFAATGNYASATGVDKTGLSLPASTSVTIDISNTLSTANSSTAAVTLYQDELTFQLTYAFIYAATGGVQTGGSAPVSKTKAYAASGGVQTGGAAPMSFIGTSALTGFGLGHGPVGSAAIGEPAPPVIAAVYALSSDPGSYGLTGSDAGLLAARLLNAGSAAYAYTGVTAGLLAARVLTGASGSYASTGTDAGLVISRVLSALAGGYAVSGQAAGLPASRVLVGGVGAYALNGTDAAAVRAAVLSALAGSYGLTGSTAALLGGFALPGDAGAYALSGVSTNALSFALGADPGSATVVGADAEWDLVLAANASRWYVVGERRRRR
jgi:hypothetical protein